MLVKEAIEKIENLLNKKRFIQNITTSERHAIIMGKIALKKDLRLKPKKVMRTDSNSKTISEITKFNSYNSSDKKEVPEYKEYKYSDYLCPRCNALTKDGTPDYCWRCGQALDWSDS